jgi:hypothetical protein
VTDLSRSADKKAVNERIAALVHQIRALEEELEMELARRRIDLGLIVRDRSIRFEQVVIARHKLIRTRLAGYVLAATPLMLRTAPAIYALSAPLLLLDAFLYCYQAVCFPVYGVPKVRRADYFVFDRAHLAYLNAIERINCAYCSYANGLIGYAREIASRTEQYWCPIKHARGIISAHARYTSFVDYGDAEAYHHEFAVLRRQLQKPPGRTEAAP